MFYRGATLDVSLTITDSETGFPVDLTGATVKFRLAQTLGYPAAYEASMTIGTGGTATLTIPPDKTLEFSGSNPYAYTVHVTESSGNVFIAAQGSIQFTNIVKAAM